MEQCRLDGSPITYHVSRKEQAEWVLLPQAAELVSAEIAAGKGE